MLIGDSFRILYCMYNYFLDEGVSIGGKIPTTMTLLKVTSGGTDTAQVPIVHVADGQSKSFCSYLRSPMNFAKVLIFYPRLAIANPAVGRFSKETLLAAEKLSFTVAFDVSVSFYTVVIDVISGYVSLKYLFHLQGYSTGNRFGSGNDWGRLR